MIHYEFGPQLLLTRTLRHREDPVQCCVSTDALHQFLSLTHTHPLVSKGLHVLFPLHPMLFPTCVLGSPSAPSTVSTPTTPVSCSPCHLSNNAPLHVRESPYAQPP